MSVTVRPTAPEEAAMLHEIQKAAFLPLYERYHDKGNPCLRGMEDITARIGSPHFRCFTICEGDDVVGGAIYRCSGGGLSEGEYYLYRIYIKPGRQCKGIAQRAIALCEREFPGAVRFTVDFPEDLIKNQRCYEAAGFRDTGKRIAVEDGLTLACYEKRCGKTHI